MTTTIMFPNNSFHFPKIEAARGLYVEVTMKDGQFFCGIGAGYEVGRLANHNLLIEEDIHLHPIPMKDVYSFVIYDDAKVGA